jgi:hypothetical protein
MAEVEAKKLKVEAEARIVALFEASASRACSVEPNRVRETGGVAPPSSRMYGMLLRFHFLGMGVAYLSSRPRMVASSYEADSEAGVGLGRPLGQSESASASGSDEAPDRGDGEAIAFVGDRERERKRG